MDDEKNDDPMARRYSPESDTQPDRFTDGRDELNLADFPISVLQRQQPQDEDGRKLDQTTYESTTYDPVSRRRVPQRVTLTTSSRYGLPTPADENVVLALIYTAKRAHDFTVPRVHFSPFQLFQIMGWALNSRSYERLSQVLRRLKALTILYENAWWDATGRKYQEEFATGIIAEYRIIKTKARRRAESDPPSYVHWTPQFFKSLSEGNLKKLNLDQLFALRLPTSQRMYRFLDKRFYTSPVVELDLRDFAFGHLGMTKTPNIAEIKRRLVPAIAELEQLGFIAPAAPANRYRKVRPKVWRIRFERAGTPPAVGREAPALPPSIPEGVLPSPSPEFELVAGFYRVWAPEGDFRPTEAEMAQARELITQYGATETPPLLPAVIKQMREKFPDAKRFGASLSYFAEAAQQQAMRTQHQRRIDEETRRRQAERQEAERQRAEDRAFETRWLPVWEALPTPQQEEIRGAVLKTYPYLASPKLRQSHLATRFCLEELARRSKPPIDDVADGRQTAQ